MSDLLPEPPIPPKPAEAFRVLHTADWHLGKFLGEQSRDEEHGRFLAWLLAVVREHRVDAILLAGDVFDSANPPLVAQSRYYDFVSGLFQQGSCTLVVIGGNHDSAAQLEAPRHVLRALHVHVAGSLAEEPAARLLCLPPAGPPRVALALVPFLRDRDLRVGHAGESGEETRARLIAGIRQRYTETAEALVDAGITCPAIATGHLTVQGARVSDSERAIHIGGLGAVNADCFPAAFAYVALGHLHGPQAAGGDERIRYAGSPIPLAFSEAADRKEVRILDVTAGGLTQKALPIPTFRRLIQIRTSTAGLDAAIAALPADAGGLKTWIEVVVEDATLADDLNERARELAAARGVEVLKVLRGRPVTSTGLDAEDQTDDETIDTLLEEPARVFDHLLAGQGELTETERGELRAAFFELVDRDAQTGGTSGP